MNFEPKTCLPVIIDTDPGVDDALALLFALRSGLFEVKAITVVAGNCSVDQGVENTFRIYEALAGTSGNGGGGFTFPPVYRGTEGPLRITYQHALHVHGNDGLGGISLLWDGDRPRYPRPTCDVSPTHAVDAMLEIIDRHPGEITLLTLGPLTNVALAIQRSAETMAKVKRIVCMAGAFGEPGNVTAAAEYNVWADPEACTLALEAHERWQAERGEDAPRLEFVGLDVTHQLVLTGEMLESWLGEEPDPYGQFLADFTRSTMAFHRETRGWDGMYLHDPAAVIFAARPDLGQRTQMHVQVECEGRWTRGMTVADRRGTLLPPAGVPVDVFTSAQAEAMFELFQQGLLG